MKTAQNIFLVLSIIGTGAVIQCGYGIDSISLSLSEQATNAANTVVEYAYPTKTPKFTSFECEDNVCLLGFTDTSGQKIACGFEADSKTEIFNKNSQGEYIFTPYFYGNLTHCLKGDK